MHKCNLYDVLVQFDTELTSKEAILEAVELINLALQREPYNLAAQIFINPDSLNYDVVELYDSNILEE